MAFRIPLGGQLQARPAFTIPLTPRAGQPSTPREAALQRAVVGAIALQDPAQALAAVKTAREKPERPFTYKEEDVSPVLQAVARAQEERPGDVVPDDGQRAVAAAIGADPLLIVVAAKAIKDGGNAAADGARLWASIDADLLERAARAAARERQFALVPDSTSRLERIEKRLEALEARVTKLDRGG